MSISVVILAAGQGTRMKSDTPKVLHTISGKPMLFHAIDAAKEISDDVTVVLYHQADRIRKIVEEAYEGIVFHIQDAQNFPGTGGAMMGITPRHERTLIVITSYSIHYTKLYDFTTDDLKVYSCFFLDLFQYT